MRHNPSQIPFRIGVSGHHAAPHDDVVLHLAQRNVSGSVSVRDDLDQLKLCAALAPKQGRIAQQDLFERRAWCQVGRQRNR